MKKQDRVLRLPEVLKITGLSHSTIWRKEKEGTFPGRLSLGPNSSGWLMSEVNEWLESMVKERDNLITSREGEKSWISSKREATAMNTASQLSRQNQKLETGPNHPLVERGVPSQQGDIHPDRKTAIQRVQGHGL